MIFNMWKPIKEDRIKRDISYCSDALFNKPNCLKFWEYIKIAPEKWQEKMMGNQGGGFWVVAILGKSVAIIMILKKVIIFHLSQITEKLTITIVPKWNYMR